MLRSSLSASAWSRIAMVLVLTVTSSACSKKKVVVDPNDGVEGVASGSQLIVWRENPNPIYVFTDRGNPGPSWLESQNQFTFEDELVGESVAYETSPETVRGFIFDYTRAGQYEILRHDGGEFRSFKDYLLTPTRRFPGFDTDLFLFADPQPLPGPAPEYLGRGAIEGVITALSPKTNVATVTQDAVDPGVLVRTRTGLNPNQPPPTDSVFVLEWDSYPEAAGYWVHIYTFTTQNAAQKILSGVPAPFYVGTTRDHLLAFFPDSPSGPAARVVSLKNQYPFLVGQIVLVRISAVDANGQLIAMTSKTRENMVAELVTPSSWSANRDNYIVNFPGPGSEVSPGTYEVSPLGVVAFQFWGRYGASIRPPNSAPIMIGASPTGRGARMEGPGSP